MHIYTKILKWFTLCYCFSLARLDYSIFKCFKIVTWLYQLSQILFVCHTSNKIVKEVYSLLLSCHQLDLIILYVNAPKS